MKINAIIYRYIFKEILIPFSICLSFFTLLFLMAEMLKIVDFMVSYSVSLFTVLMLLVFSILQFMLFVIPMSSMLSILLAFMRLSADNEITALKSGGVNIYRLLPPVLLFCFLGWLLTIYISIYGMPMGQAAARELVYNSIASNIGAGLKDKERTFNGDFDGVMIYINKIDVNGNELKDVFIEDHRYKGFRYIVTAPKGKFQSDPEKLKLSLKLYDGFINYVDVKGRISPGRFGHFNVAFDLEKKAINTRKYDKEVSVEGLIKIIKKRSKKKDEKYIRALLKLHQIFSIPFACFTLGLLAVPLGIQSKSAKGSAGLVIGLGLFLAYYIMLSGGMALSEASKYPPAAAMWIPNLIMGSLGVFLLVKTANEKSFNINFFVPWSRSIRKYIVKKFNKKTRL